MFRYERVNLTRKFTIVALIIFLLKKIYKEDVPLGAVFKVKTLAVLFPPYPCEIKNIGTQGVQELFFCDLEAPGGCSTRWTHKGKSFMCTGVTDSSQCHYKV